MLPQQEIDEQLELLRTYRRTLATYLRQQAAIGEAYSPPALSYGIAEARSHIQRIKAALRAAGVEVPEDIDDDEPPPLVLLHRPNRVRIGLLVAVAAAAGLILALGLALGNFGASRLVGQEPTTPAGSLNSAPNPPAPVEASRVDQAATAEPASETSKVEAPATREPTGTTLFVEYSFEDGQASGWSGVPEQWQVVQSDDGYVYQAKAPPGDYSAATPPNVGMFADLPNYAVEMRVKIVQPDTPDDDLSALWLSLRAQYQASDGCDAYNFRFALAEHRATISLAGDRPGCDQDLAQGPISLDTGAWHTIRAEVDGDQLRLLVDGAPVASATDTALAKGFFYITVGPGATVQFANIRVDRL